MQTLPLFTEPLHDGEDPALLNPLVLAYLGDTLYDLYVRTRLVQTTHAQAGRLHKQAIHYVCAAGQARALQSLMDMLTEKEAAVVLNTPRLRITVMPLPLNPF